MIRKNITKRRLFTRNEPPLQCRPRGVTTGHDRNARRTALWIRETIGKPYAVLGQSIEVRSLIGETTVAFQTLRA